MVRLYAELGRRLALGLVVAVLLVVTAHGCAGASRDELLAGKACDAGVCAAGYICDPATDVCVPEGTPIGQGGGGPAGGAGGQGGGQGGAGGCQDVTDCPAPADCIEALCVAGACATTLAPAGTPLPPSKQVAGDCSLKLCAEQAMVIEAVDDEDVPDDGSDCTVDQCNRGVPTNDARELGVSCGNMGVCDGLGSCIECLSASDCSWLPPDDECQQRVCDAGLCTQVFQDLNTVVGGQSSGDCQQKRCDGQGAIVSHDDDLDVPLDGNACTEDVCTVGVPSNPPTMSGSNCPAGSCDGNGNCTGCTSAAECGSDSFCKQHTCSNNICGTILTVAMTELPANQQTNGDCQKLWCDGNGNAVTTDDNGDAPPDDGNACTTDVCVSGSPQHPFAALNTSCNQNGGSYCDGAGACVACNSASQCPQGTACQAASCNAATCSLDNIAANMLAPPSAQVTGDCKKVVCDGMGGSAQQPLVTDVPVDGNDCTNDKCTGSTPSNPPLMAGTSCAMGAGSCDGNGNCVTP